MFAACCIQDVMFSLLCLSLMQSLCMSVMCAWMCVCVCGVSVQICFCMLNIEVIKFLSRFALLQNAMHTRANTLTYKHKHTITCGKNYF